MDVEKLMARGNFDDMVEDCRIIMGACGLLNMPAYLAEEWVSEYVSRNGWLEICCLQDREVN